jgi:hypothetical protein
MFSSPLSHFGKAGNPRPVCLKAHKPETETAETRDCFSFPFAIAFLESTPFVFRDQLLQRSIRNGIILSITTY